MYETEEDKDLFSACADCMGDDDDYYMDDEGNWVSSCEDCPWCDRG